MKPIKRGVCMKNLGLHVIEYPSGRFGFVGSVPSKLAYVTKAGNFVTDAEVEANMRLPASARMIKTRSFESADEAWLEAARLGFVEVEAV